MIAPALRKAADEIGGVGAVREGKTVGCCAEFQGANELMLKDANIPLDALRFTPAIRPRTGQSIEPCQNCLDIFKQLRKE